MSSKGVFYNAVGILRGRWLRGVKPLTPKMFFSNEVSVLPSGFNQLDRAIGLKGLPQGYITELIGPNATGLLTIAAKIGAKFQRKQLPVKFIDMANNFDMAHAVRCGLVAPELLCFKPATAFELIGVMRQAARDEGLVVINLGFVPQTLGQAPSNTLNALLKRLSDMVKCSKSVFLCLTMPEDINPLIHTNYPAGFALYDVASVRLWVQDEGWIKSKQQVTGYKGSVTVIKNTLAMEGKGANLRVPFVDPELMRLMETYGF